MKAICHHTYIMFLLCTSSQWRGFKSRDWTIGEFVSFVYLFLDFKRVVYHEEVCTFIAERK